MLKEKLAAKADDDAKQLSLGGNYQPPDITSKPPPVAGAMPVLPPVTNKMKSLRPEPLKISDANESLKAQGEKRSGRLLFV